MRNTQPEPTDAAASVRLFVLLCPDVSNANGPDRAGKIKTINLSGDRPELRRTHPHHWSSDPEKVKIGTISDLILSKDGKNVDGFVIGVGGFLGIGEKAVALKLDRLKMALQADGTLFLLMDVKKDELANAPTFKSKKEQLAEKQAAERARSQPSSGGPGRPAPKTN